MHDGVLFRLTPATTREELAWVAEEDRKAFTPWPSVTAKELGVVATAGSVLLLRSPSDGRFLGCAQIVLDRTRDNDLGSDEAYCYGSFVVRNERRRGYGAILRAAQETLARARGKRLLSLTVRPGNVASLAARLGDGFRVVDYNSAAFGDWKNGGSRLVMRKHLFIDDESFDVDEHHERIAEGLAVRCSADAAADSIRTIPEIAVEVPSEVVVTTQADVAAQRTTDLALATAAKTLIDAGYVGVGWDNASASAPGALVYRRPGLPPSRRPSRLAIHDEVSRAREVIVNYESFVGNITPDAAINDVARANVGRVDAIAEVREYRSFVDALKRAGVHVIRTNACGAEGRLARFARDPSFVLRRLAFISNMERRPRHPEGKAHSYLFRGLEQIDTRECSSVRVEGGDVFMAGADWIIVGIGTHEGNVRTNAAGADLIDEAFPTAHVTRVHHEDLHLDVLFSFASRNHVVIRRPALPPTFLDELCGRGYTLIDCDEEEQETMGCNLFAVDDGVVIAAAQNVRVNAALRAHRVRVIEVDIAGLVKHGGGPRCMTCPVWRD